MLRMLNGTSAAGDRDGAALTESVHAEAGEARDRVGEVDLTFLGELAQAVVRGQHLAQHPLGVGGRKRFGSDADEVALEAHQGRRRHLQVKVRPVRSTTVRRACCRSNGIPGLFIGTPAGA